MKEPLQPLPPRSYLFVPGDRPDFLAKAESRGADAIIVDLEDAVAPSRKTFARTEVARWLGACNHPERVWVRVNRGVFQEADLDAVTGLSFSGLMLPKVEGPDEISPVLSRLPRESRTLVIVETAKALRVLDEIAAEEGVYQLMIGEADLGANVGLAPRHPAWDSIRVDLVTASIAAGIAPPIASVSPDFTDLAALEHETRHFRDMGYVSRPAIHPAQIDTINSGFMPSDLEVENARRILGGHERALAEHAGAHSHDGRLVDEAFVRRARLVIAASERS